jgi:superfamily I DNA and/or RNA helicase
MMASSPEKHFDRLRRWLDLEARAEAEQLRERARRRSGDAAERSGMCLIGLIVRDESSALGGRVTVTLGKRHDVRLPWTRLQSGTPVVLSEENGDEAGDLRGVVSWRDEKTIDVMLNDSPEPVADRPTFRLDLSSDEISRQRQLTAINKAATVERGRLAELRTVLLGEREPKWTEPKSFTPLDRYLNASQQAAVKRSLAADDVAVIHGPPGTGKTTAVIELIRQAVARGERVLACAPSNLAVDNVGERLIAAGVKVVRLGHPARILPQLHEHTLDVLVENHPDVKVARGLVKDARILRRQASKWTRAKPVPGKKYEQRQEAKELLADARRLESRAVEHILDTAEVVCATLTGLDDELLGKRVFDLIVIDEAAQATEPACWIPLARGRRVVFAGDHCQLPPTILSTDAARDGYSMSLMERLVKHFGDEITSQLTTQYRMHAAIMEFSSGMFYDGTLVADPSVAEHRLCDLADVAESDLTTSPLLFIDTAGAGFDEEAEPDGDSRWNPGEIDLVVEQVQFLLDAGVAASGIAVIAPYAAQVRGLRDRLSIPDLEIDTVDGFQGREKEAVVISLVRSNGKGELGFLTDTRRLNVALTRARRKLIVIGDSATLASHMFFQQLLEHFELYSAYRTVWELG